MTRNRRRERVRVRGGEVWKETGQRREQREHRASSVECRECWSMGSRSRVLRSERSREECREVWWALLSHEMQKTVRPAVTAILCTSLGEVLIAKRNDIDRTSLAVLCWLPRSTSRHSPSAFILGRKFPPNGDD